MKMFRPSLKRTAPAKKTESPKISFGHHMLLAGGIALLTAMSPAHGQPQAPRAKPTVPTAASIRTMGPAQQHAAINQALQALLQKTKPDHRNNETEETELPYRIHNGEMILKLGDLHLGLGPAPDVHSIETYGRSNAANPWIMRLANESEFKLGKDVGGTFLISRDMVGKAVPDMGRGLTGNTMGPYRLLHQFGPGDHTEVETEIGNGRFGLLLKKLIGPRGFERASMLIHIGKKPEVENETDHSIHLELGVQREKETEVERAGPMEGDQEYTTPKTRQKTVLKAILSITNGNGHVQFLYNPTTKKLEPFVQLRIPLGAGGQGKRAPKETDFDKKEQKE